LRKLIFAAVIATILVLALSLGVGAENIPPCCL